MTLIKQFFPCWNHLRMAIALGGTVLVQAWSLGLYAATAPIVISGSINVKPQCVVNDNQTIRVAFGNDLITTKVNGVNYLRTIDYTLECKNAGQSMMKMKLAGVAAAFNSTAIQTDKANLAIALRANGNPLPIGSWMAFNYPNKPVLQAVPVSGGVLATGAFSAAATLMVEYL
ncbi:putative minor fimbrial subunit StfF [Serratia marcescens]|uniref:fimbrial protein n=1 Tax=Serratia marcescens TaxID=615 RepID=UPI00217A0CB4|nr:fimbrial protein [Serratia marcescens]CAI1128282.1 putative minor fimbrial subunit StfF [Serratia marcescens]CAI1155170.1 putative minor fimbrial subunit StfF [Serratia marcescens]CAI1923782.1 putative minor fimbrial subunit StfF [Serratia marcescens]CAI1985305.1 putative minor fimbrial subunit StfF [Serratia marcescens]